MTDLYLDPSVAAEPLYDRFYASALLVSPVTAAMQVVNGHLRILDSYAKNPHIHRAATQSPELRGGPFIDYEADRSTEIAALHLHTRDVSRLQEEFVLGVRALCDDLERDARGMPLEPFYDRLPDVLAGLVELGYDYLNRPRLRVVEPLLYRSPLYRKAAQSFSLRRLVGDHRPSGASTPRLPDEVTLDLQVSYDSPQIDWLFGTQTRGAPLETFYERLELAHDDARMRLGRLVTEEPGRTALRFDGDGLRLRYFGHACLLLETREVSVLVDPLLSYEYADQGGTNRYTLCDLPERIDYVLLSHNHIDHVSLETLLRLRGRIGQVVVPRSGGDSLLDPSLRLALIHAGFTNVRELDELETLELPGGRVMGVPFFGEHGDHDIHTKLAHHIELGGQALLCVTDSANLSPAMYDRVHQVTGDVDRLFVGMECEGGPQSWLYGPLLVRRLEYSADQARRLNGSDCAKAMALVERFSPREAFVYAMASEPWIRFISAVEYTPQSKPIVESDSFVASCQSRGIAASRMFAQAEFIWEVPGR